MPTAITPNPPLQLVNLPVARVDWDRTSRYAATARASHYIADPGRNRLRGALERRRVDAERGDVDGRAVAAAGDRAAGASDARRLAAEPFQLPRRRGPADAGHARRRDRRPAGVAQSGPLRAHLVGVSDPPTIVEPLLPPPPTPREAIEQVLTAARTVDMSADRTSLLATAVEAIDLNKSSLPPQWAAAARLEATAEIAKEVRLDRSYQTLTAQMMTVANRRARAADVRGLERVVRVINQRDEALGAKRPDAVAFADCRGRGEARRGTAAAAGARSLRAPGAGAEASTASRCGSRSISSPN